MSRVRQVRLTVTFASCAPGSSDCDAYRLDEGAQPDRRQIGRAEPPLGR